MRERFEDEPGFIPEQHLEAQETKDPQYDVLAGLLIVKEFL